MNFLRGGMYVNSHSKMVIIQTFCQVDPEGVVTYIHPFIFSFATVIG